MQTKVCFLAFFQQEDPPTLLANTLLSIFLGEKPPRVFSQKTFARKFMEHTFKGHPHIYLYFLSSQTLILQTLVTN